MDRPDFLSQGEPARLFPVLATTSKEGRTTSIVLACLSKIDEFGAAMLGQVGQRAGVRSKLETFTEITFRDAKIQGDRPDGLIIHKNGKREWRALVEAKVGNSDLNPEQIERYRNLAKDIGADCVITISNQFATVPEHHPLEDVRKSRSKIPVYHWSWMSILTQADLLISNDSIGDTDQKILLNELRRFLTHESAGIKGFDRMPPAWGELNKLISAGGKIPARSAEAIEVIEAWHQETKDLSLILSRQTETLVLEKLSRKHQSDPGLRKRDELQQLRETNQLCAVLDIRDACAPLEISADLSRRTVDVGMTLRAPEDKKSSKARVNWLIRQITSENLENTFVRLQWPGRSEATQFALADLRETPEICETDKGGLQVLGFHIYSASRLGARFTQQVNFISDLEQVVPQFYRDIGQNLTAWRKAAPKIRPEKTMKEDVDIDAIEDHAEDLAQE